MSYYDPQGQPISFERWSELFNRPRIVAWSQPFAGVEVSTVWLGLDHAFLGGPPLIFETMVFGGPLDQEQMRYSTTDQARQGHEDMLLRVRAAHAGRTA